MRGGRVRIRRAVDVAPARESGQIFARTAAEHQYLRTTAASLPRRSGNHRVLPARSPDSGLVVMWGLRFGGWTAISGFRPRAPSMHHLCTIHAVRELRFPRDLGGIE
jgi:hypothetical protein